MDGSHRSVSSVPNDVDENEENHHQVFANSQNLKKAAAKNYMSSTISAASKAIAPRKKILAERNEASEPTSFDAEAKKNSVLDNCGGDGLYQEEAKSPQVSQFNGDDEKEEEFLFKPYDPVTNYLSPRPRFLRYKPNRRREIFQGREDGSGESEDGLIGRNGSSSSSSSSASMITGEIFGQKDEDVEAAGTDEVFEESDEIEIEDDEEEEEEEEYEERGCYIEGGMKTMLLLLVLGLSAMLITALNCSTPSCGLGFYKGIESGYYGTGNHSLEAVLAKNPESGSVFSHRVAFENVVEEGIVIEKSNFEQTYSEELDSKEVAEVAESGEVVQPEVVVVEEVLNKVVGDSENQGLDTLEKVEDSQNQPMKFSTQHHDAGSSDSNVFEEQKASEVNPVEQVIIAGKTEEFGPRSVSKEVAKIVENLQQIEAEFALKVLIGVVTCFTAVAYLLLGLQLKPKKVGKKGSSSRAKPRCESPRVEQEKTTKKAHFASPTSQPLMKEHSEQEYSQSHAPSVEFLGELVVREIKSSAKKNRTTESHSVSLRAPPTRSDLLTTTDSPLFGSYSTAEKKTANKEDREANFATTPTQARRSSRDGEVSISTTPVRRSSRIRNRSIISP